MIRTTYLRVYQPLEAFGEEERSRWAARPTNPSDSTGAPAPSRQWLMKATLPSPDLASPSEGAFVREVDGRTFACPWRTRLRMLAGLVAFRGSVPEEVADAFVPQSSLTYAAEELAAMEAAETLRSHIVHANWHVPLRWFAAFDDLERVLVEDKEGLRIRYETPLAQARSRLGHAVEVLQGARLDDEITEAVRELAEWLTSFDGDGLLELDYGGVARSFSEEELLEDHSAADVRTCLEALEAGDVVGAGRLFASLTERWSGARAAELVN